MIGGSSVTKTKKLGVRGKRRGDRGNRERRKEKKINVGIRRKKGSFVTSEEVSLQKQT